MPVAARAQEPINELESLASARVGKIDEQDLGAKKPESSRAAVPRRFFITPFTHLANILKLDTKASLRSAA